MLKRMDRKMYLFLDAEAKMKAETAKAKEKLKKAQKELQKVKDPQKKPLIQRVLQKIKRIISSPFVQAGALLGVAALVRRIALEWETSPAQIEARRRARMAENAANLRANNEQARQEANATSNAENLINSAMGNAQTAEAAARVAEVVRESGNSGVPKSGLSRPLIIRGREIDPSKYSSIHGGNKAFTVSRGSGGSRSAENSHRISFGQDLLNRIKNHASSKLFKYRGSGGGKFGEKFFSSVANEKPSLQMGGYSGEADPRFSSIEMNSAETVAQAEAARNAAPRSPAEILAELRNEANNPHYRYGDPRTMRITRHKKDSTSLTRYIDRRIAMLLDGPLSAAAEAAISRGKGLASAAKKNAAARAAAKAAKSGGSVEARAANLARQAAENKSARNIANLVRSQAKAIAASSGFGGAMKAIGGAIKSGAQKVGGAVKSGAKKVAEKVKGKKAAEPEKLGIVGKAKKWVKENPGKAAAIGAGLGVGAGVGLHKLAGRDDSGYLLRNYAEMPWAYADAVSKKVKKRIRRREYEF